jgi:hypothetical protein
VCSSRRLGAACRLPPRPVFKPDLHLPRPRNNWYLAGVAPLLLGHPGTGVYRGVVSILAGAQPLGHAWRSAVNISRRRAPLHAGAVFAFATPLTPLYPPVEADGSAEDRLRGVLYREAEHGTDPVSNWIYNTLCPRPEGEVVYASPNRRVQHGAVGLVPPALKQVSLSGGFIQPHTPFQP